MQMLSGLENLRSGLDAPSRRLIAAPEAVAAVRDTAGTGARTARGQRDAARDRGDRPPRPERMNGGSVSAPAPPDESPAPPGLEPESAGGDQHALQVLDGNPAGGNPAVQVLDGDPAGSDSAGADSSGGGPAAQGLDGNPAGGNPAGGNPAGGGPAGGDPAGGNQPSARRTVAALEPELSDLMAARRAYAAGMMLIQTRGQTIPAGAVLDGTI